MKTTCLILLTFLFLVVGLLTLLGYVVLELIMPTIKELLP